MWHKIIVWLITEIILNVLGIDDLADYSEFIFEKQLINFNSYHYQVNMRIAPSYFSMFGMGNH